MTVGSQIFVAETADDLHIAVETGDHQQLLEGLGRLGQGVELAGVHPGRYDEVAGALRSGLDQIRGLDLHESLSVQVIAHLLRDPVTQGQGSLERSAAQIQVPILGAEVLAAVAFVFDGERGRDGFIENMDPL